MKAEKLNGFPPHAARIQIATFTIVLGAMMSFGTALQAQPPPVMPAVPVRPMQPPFTPVPPATPVYTQDSFAPIQVSMSNDVDIQGKINKFFTTDKLLRHMGIHVAVQNGVAIMTGVADSWQDYFRAETDAFAAGAIVVDNRLRVRFSY